MDRNWILVCGIVLGILAVCHGENFEKKLMTHLLSKYDEVARITRPVADSKDAVNLKMGMTIPRVLEFDDDNDDLKVYSFHLMMWQDVGLTWDPAAFGDLQDIRIPANKVWTPDVTLYDSMTDDLDMTKQLVVVFSNGTVLWVPQFERFVPCEAVEWRTYNCTFTFGSWTMHSRLLDVTFFDDKAEVDLSFLMPNPAWEVTGSSAWREVTEYDCCPGELYPELKFSLIIKKVGRRGLVDKAGGGN